jgi:6-phosphogluconolactonase (cycloisomerase 2 family)
LLAANASVSALYAASGSNIDVEHINSDGSLTTTATLNAQPLNSIVGTYWDLSFDSTAQLLYALAVHGSGTGSWEIYKAGSDGSLSSAGSQGTGPAAAHLYFTPDGKRAFSKECYHLDGAIWGYSVGSGNNLTSFDTKAPVPNFGSAFPACPFAMSITSDGSRLAAQLNPKTGTAAGVAIYSVNGDGTLTAQPGSPLTTSAQGSDIAWDPLGRYVAVGAKDGLWIYSSASGSAPAPVGGAPIVTGSIDHVAFNKAGTLLFAVNASAQNIYVFNFNSSTGAATPALGPPHSMNLAPYELVVAER